MVRKVNTSKRRLKHKKNKVELIIHNFLINLLYSLRKKLHRNDSRTLCRHILCMEQMILMVCYHCWNRRLWNCFVLFESNLISHVRIVRMMSNFCRRRERSSRWGGCACKTTIAEKHEKKTWLDLRVKYAGFLSSLLHKCKFLIW